MRPNRKADLQRKLTLAAVPTPPAGLAERIKTDIPKHLPDSTAERRRLGTAVAFNMRVAASILLLVGSLFVALQLLNRAYQDDDSRMRAFSQALEKNTPPSSAVSPLPKLGQRAPQVVTSTEEAPSAVAPPQLKTKKLDNQFANAQTSQGETQPADAKAKKVVDQVADAGARNEREKDEAANSPVASFDSLDKQQRDDRGRATTPPAPPMAPKPAAAPPVSVATAESRKAAVAEAAPAASESIRVTAEAPALAATGGAAPQKAANELATRQAAAGFSAPGPTTHLAGRTRLQAFGYDLDRDPAGGVTPLVQYFSAPVEPPQRSVRLEADAAPSPLDPSKGVLRFSIDTAANRAGTPAVQVAANVHLEVVINSNAVVSQRALTGRPSVAEPSLRDGTSITAVYEFQLVPSIAGDTPLATVRLRYHSLPDGSERTLEKNIRVSDIAKSWDVAPERTKRASLAAALGETRAHGGDTSAIARKARAIGLDELAELAKQR